MIGVALALNTNAGRVPIVNRVLAGVTGAVLVFFCAILRAWRSSVSRYVAIARYLGGDRLGRRARAFLNGCHELITISWVVFIVLDDIPALQPMEQTTMQLARALEES
jgi:hypothetical protein